MTGKIERFLLCLSIVFLHGFVEAQQPVPAPESRPPRAAGQKYIEEVWHELETKSFREPTFDELATTHEGFSFDELWDICRRHHPSIVQKMNLVAAAQGGRVQAGLYPNPTGSYSWDNIGVNDDVGKIGLGVSQEVVTAGKKKLDRAVASYDVEAARREYDMECQRVQNDLRIAHCELIHAHLVVKIERFCLQLSRELLDAAKKLEAEGKTRSVDVLQFQTMLDTAALTLRQAEIDEKSAWQRLAVVMGTPDLPFRPVRGTLLEPEEIERNREETWMRFRATSPQLAVARLREQQARMNLYRQEAERYSNVSANFQLSRDIPAKTMVPFVGISMPLKVYDKNQGNILKAKGNVAASRREVQRQELALRKEMVDIFRDYENARELLGVYEKSIIPNSFEALRKLTAIYDRGEAGYIELFNQRQAVLAALIQYVDALKTQAVCATLLDGMMLQGALE